VNTVPLTRRQRDILVFLQAYLDEHSISPTLEEIATHFGVNKVTVFGHVRELERKGVITRGERGASRTLQPVREEPVASSPAKVCVLGRIAAGSPIEAVEEAEVLDLSTLVPSDRDVYALRVQGDSMIEDAIRDGDIVIVERRDHARDGETVVAVLEDEQTTLKRLYREPTGYRLQPANAALEPLYVQDLQIRGVVIGVVRQYSSR
jgi:repressor LexA